MDAVAGPLVVLRRADHPGATRVFFDVAQTREPILVVTDAEAAIAPGPERADPPVPAIEVTHIFLSDLLHHRRQRWHRARRHYQVIVVGHQSERVDSYAA